MKHTNPKVEELNPSCAVVLELSLSRIPPSEATAHSSVSHADRSTDGGFSSDVLNVTFDLALDDWGDFSDDNFMTACEDSYDQGCGAARITGASFLLDLLV